MNSVKHLPMLFLIIVFALVALSCSNSKSPVEPVAGDFPDIIANFPEDESVDTGNRSPLAIYDAVIDPVAGTFTITPVERDLQYHFPLSQLYPNVLQITGYGFTPNFWANIKLTHPYPGSGIDGFDPRVIAILPANPGVSFNYPEMDCTGNNSVVLEPDGYTKLFDSLSGSIPGNTNPFKAYFKTQPHRVWSGSGVTYETQKWNMNLAGFGGPMQYKLVVDVSTNYPNPPAPVTDNAPEAVQIDATIGSGLTQNGGSTEVSITLLDWQGITRVVRVEAPDLFSGTVKLTYYGPGLNPDEYVYRGKITNDKKAPEGEYKILVSSWDRTSDIYIYDEFKATVSYAAPSGNLIWANRAGGALTFEKGYAITTLSQNATVVTGIFEGTATFGPGEANETVLTSRGGYDIFVARYYYGGTLNWVKQAGGTNDDEGWGITSFGDNSTIVTGNFKGTATFGLGETNETILTSAGNNDIFIARYLSNGTLSWAKRIGNTSLDYGYGATSLSDNSAVVTGMFYGTATFGPGEPNETVLTSTGSVDVFLARYNSNGTLVWAKCAGGTSSDYGLGATTLSDNSTVVTGYYNASATFGQGDPNQTILTSYGGSDIFVARYNPDGSLLWAKSAGGSDNYDEGHSITTLSDDSTVVTGYFYGLAIFGIGEANQTILNSAGYYDIFVARYNTDGTLAWVKGAGASSVDHGYAITSLSDDTTIAVGFYNGTVTFGKDEPNETTLTGYSNMFVARYNPDGTLLWAKQAGGEGSDSARAITTLSNNSVVVSGYFEDAATFGGGEPNETILTSAGGFDIFVANFEP